MGPSPRSSSHQSRPDSSSGPSLSSPVVRSGREANECVVEVARTPALQDRCQRRSQQAGVGPPNGTSRSSPLRRPPVRGYLPDSEQLRIELHGSVEQRRLAPLAVAGPRCILAAALDQSEPGNGRRNRSANSTSATQSGLSGTASPGSTLRRISVSVSCH